MEATRSEPTAQDDCVHRDRPIERDNHHRGPPLEGLRAKLGVTAGVAPQLDRPTTTSMQSSHDEEKGETARPTARFEGGRASHLGAPDRPSSHPHHLCGGFSNLGEDGGTTMSRYAEAAPARTPAPSSDTARGGVGACADSNPSQKVPAYVSADPGDAG